MTIATTTERAQDDTVSIMDEPEQQDPVAPAIVVEGLGLRTRRGWVYRAVDMEVPAGSATILSPPPHSGRTALLLTLAGRMRPSQGRATVEGLDVVRDAARVRSIVAMGLIAGVNDLEGELSVGDHVRRELAMYGRERDREAIAKVLSAAGRDVDLATPADELPPDDRILLGVGLALVGSPKVIVVDDLDMGLDAKGRARVRRTLLDIAAAGTTILAMGLASGPATDPEAPTTLGTIKENER